MYKEICHITHSLPLIGMAGPLIGMADPSGESGNLAYSPIYGHMYLRISFEQESFSQSR